MPTSKCAAPAECTDTIRYPSFIESYELSNESVKARVGNGNYAGAVTSSGVIAARTTSTHALPLQHKKSCVMTNQRGKGNNTKVRDKMSRVTKVANDIRHKAAFSAKGIKNENEKEGTGGKSETKDRNVEKFMVSDISNDTEGTSGEICSPRRDNDEKGKFDIEEIKSHTDALLADTVESDTEKAIKMKILTRASDDSVRPRNNDDIDGMLKSMTGSCRRSRGRSNSNSRGLCTSRSEMPHTQESKLHRTRKSIPSSTGTHTSAHTNIPVKHIDKYPGEAAEKERESEREMESEGQGKQASSSNSDAYEGLFEIDTDDDLAIIKSKNR